MDPTIESTVLPDDKEMNSSVAPRNPISYPCGTCGKTFPFNFHLQRHILSHHQTDKSSPKRILSQDQPLTPFKRTCSRQSTAASNCEFCGKHFNLPLFLHQHIASVHPNGPRKADTRRALQSGVTHDCEHCGKSFTFNSQLHDHIANAHVVEIAPISSVAESIEQTPEERSRKPLYKSSEENICETCGRTFSSIYNLQRHLKNLHNIDSVLIRPSDQKSYLEKTSTGVSTPARSTPKVSTPAPASSAKVSTPVPATPKVPIPIPDVITYTCDECDKVFVFKNSLRDHITREHSTEPDNTIDDTENQTPIRKTDDGSSCEACMKPFSTTFNLLRHLRNVHHVDAVFDTSITMKVIIIVGKLPFVESIHAARPENDVIHECLKCGEVFQSNSELGDHIAREHLKNKSIRSIESYGIIGNPVVQMGMSISDNHKEIASSGKNLSDKAASPEPLSGAEITATSLGVEIETPLSSTAGIVMKNSCAICANSFASYQNLLRHLKNIHHVKFVKSEPGERRASAAAQLSGGDVTSDNNCVQCSKLFSTATKLRHHILSVHTTKFSQDEIEAASTEQSNEIFPCHVCNGTFCSFHNLLRHLRNVHKIIGLRDRDSYARLTNTPIHHKPLTLFSCRFCDKQFKLNFILRRHVASAHPDVPLVPENLDPNASHSGPMRLACDLCGETFKLNFHLRRHIATAHASAHFCMLPGKKPSAPKPPQKAASNPQCEQCGKQFKLNIQLRRHLKTVHTVAESPGNHNAKSDKKTDLNNKDNEDGNHSTSVERKLSVKSPTSTARKMKRVKCKYCDETFKLNIQLRRHIRTEHPRERPLCEPCGKRFSSHLCYVRHINTVHRTDRKPAVCEFCGKHFSQRYNLKVHLEVHTRRGKPPSCELCGKTFSSNICYQRHLKMMHSNLPPVYCEVCGKSFTQKNNLKVHMESHTRHLIRIIEAGDEIELPEPSGPDIDLDIGVNHRQLVGNDALETVEAITLELPASSDSDSSDEHRDAEDGGLDEEQDETPAIDQQRLARWRSKKEFHRKMLIKRRALKKEKDNSIMSPITNWMVEREDDGLTVVRRQHPVFMRKAIDLSQTATDTDNSHKATAAVYTTYMLA